MAASICTSIGLVAMLPGWPNDSAAASSRQTGKVDRTLFTRPATTPLMAIVSINQQRVTIYDADGALAQAPVSTGQTGYETPAGIYTVLEKNAEHYSNLYDDASMPFMQRLTWSGIALHAGALPGYPASHGCIRMPLGFSERLFERTKLGTRVVVVRDDIAPVAFAHRALFRPLSGEAAAAPSGGEHGPSAAPTRLADVSPTAGIAPPVRPRVSLRAAAAAKVAEAAAAAKAAEEARRSARSATIEAGRATKALRRATAIRARAEQQLRQAEQWAASNASERAKEAKSAAEATFAAAQAKLVEVSAEMQPKIDLAERLREQAKEAAAASAAAQEESKVAARKLSPVSVFISRATQRLYVRQAREPVFDTPVTIAEADRPIGTYLYTAVGHTEGETDLRWNVVSMYGEPGGPAKRKRDRQATVMPADEAGAKAALDRITIPPEAIEQISEMVAPGASLIVSDEGLGRETGKATEFIVVMSGEPQGGIKIRRRTSPPAEARTYRPRPYYGTSPFGWGSGPSWW